MTDYDRIDGINWSTLKHMRTSPAHYLWHRDHPTEATPAMELGTAIHAAVLEPERFATEFVFYPGRRAGKEWDQFQAEYIHQTILRQSDYDLALAIAKRVREHPVANHLLEVGEAEKTVAWTDEKTGLRCKGRIDWFNGLGIVDMKTSADISPWKFAGTAGRLGHHAQLAFYRRGLHAQQLDSPAKILAVETEPPFDVMVYAVDEDALWAGDTLIDALLAKVKDCMERNVWPGRAADEVPLQLPGWVFTDAGLPADEGLPEGLIISN